MQGHLHRCEALWLEAQSLEYKLKLNTVVAAANVEDAMSALVLRLRPDRWKVFKALQIAGQNDGALHTGVVRLHAVLYHSEVPLDESTLGRLVLFEQSDGVVRLDAPRL